MTNSGAPATPLLVTSSSVPSAFSFAVDSVARRFRVARSLPKICSWIGCADPPPAEGTPGRRVTPGMSVAKPRASRATWAAVRSRLPFSISLTCSWAKRLCCWVMSSPCPVRVKTVSTSGTCIRRSSTRVVAAWVVVRFVPGGVSRKRVKTPSS